MPDPSQTDRPSAPWLAVSLAASGAFILIQIARWPLTQLLTPFIEPFLEIAIFLGFAVVAICCLVHAIRNRRSAIRKVWLPVAICLAAVVIVATVPFNELALKVNFRHYRSRRTEIAEKLINHQTGNLISAGNEGEFVALDSIDRRLSEDGEVVIDRRDGKTFVLFFTYRGILDRFSGFVYSPTDDPPAKDEFTGDGIEITRLAPNWFWYAS